MPFARGNLRCITNKIKKLDYMKIINENYWTFGREDLKKKGLLEMHIS